MSIFKQGIGIDISDHHVRIARVNHKGEPEGLFELALPHGLIHDDMINKPKTLQGELRKLLIKAHLDTLNDPTIILVPESRVFSTYFELPADLKKLELQEEALILAQKELPMSLKTTNVNIHIGNKTKEKVGVTVNVAEKKVVKGIVSVFSKTNLPILMLEPNNSALCRFYQYYAKEEYKPPNEKSLMMIVDIGSRWTNITLYDSKNSTVFSRSLALRSLEYKSRGKKEVLTSKMIKKICGVIHTTVDYFERLGFKVPFAVVGGVEGIQKNICEECDRINKTCNAMRIGDMVEVANLSIKDVQAYGAALGAALRATRPREFKNEQFLSIEEYVKK